MNVDLSKSEMYCECGAIIHDALSSTSLLVETVDGELECPVCHITYATIGGDF